MAKNIFCIGDSLTYGNPEYGNTYPIGLQYILDSRTPGQFTAVNLGIPGEISQNTAPRFGQLLHFYRPDTLIVGIGANDMFHGVSDDTLKTHLTMMCQAAKNNNTKLLLLGMPNWRGGRQLIEDSPVYAQVGKEQGVPVQSGGYRACLANPALHYDGVHLHPGTRGYLEYSFSVANALIANNFV